MTAWTSSDALTLLSSGPETLRVPGAYGMRRPRLAREPRARTDVAGFVGFERRVRPRAAVPFPDPQTGPGHAFTVALAACRVAVGEGDGHGGTGGGGRECRVAASPRFDLSADPADPAMAVGQAVRFTLVVVDAPWAEDSSDHLPPPPGALSPAQVAAEARKRLRRRRNVVVVAGAAAETGRESSPNDAAVEAAVVAVAGSAWDEVPDVAKEHDRAHLADVQIRRVSAAGFRTVIMPSQRLIRCDDWRDFVSRVGMTGDTSTEDDDGTFLSHAVRGFFANGGSRCYVTTVNRPAFDDGPALARCLDQMAGDPAEPERDATGLERLLLVPEVAVVDLPDLYARRAPTPETFDLPPARDDGCFRPCVPGMGAVQASATPADGGEPLYDFAAVTDTQIELLRRCIAHRWRVFLLLGPPLAHDPATGRFRPPDLVAAGEWRAAFHAAISGTGVGDATEVSVAALYYPWLVVQESTGAPDRELPPTGFVAGVIAARDLLRGPAVSPANEPILTAVAATVPVDDESLADLYDPLPDPNGNSPPAVNVLRAPPGGGVELWGARTLSGDPWLRFVAVRRGLSAIQRQCHAALQRTAFEPNTPALWIQATQIVLNVLMTLFRDGALRGDRPDEAFYVRCDASLNPAESVAAGRLVVEVGAAIAAPAEFVVFRLGRNEGVVEVLE